MSRGGTLLAVALTLALSPAAAAGQTAAQPDLMFVSRHGRVLTGDDTYNSDGVGQQRNVIVQDVLVLSVRVQNDGTQAADFTIAGSPGNSDLGVRYFTHGPLETIPTMPVQNSVFAVRVLPGAFKKLRVVVDTNPDAPLGTTQTIVISATNGAATDAVRATITKVSTPE